MPHIGGLSPTRRSPDRAPSSPGPASASRSILSLLSGSAAGSQASGQRALGCGGRRGALVAYSSVGAALLVLTGVLALSNGRAAPQAQAYVRVAGREAMEASGVIGASPSLGAHASAAAEQAGHPVRPGQELELQRSGAADAAGGWAPQRHGEQQQQQSWGRQQGAPGHPVTGTQAAGGRGGSSGGSQRGGEWEQAQHSGQHAQQEGVQMRAGAQGEGCVQEAEQRLERQGAGQDAAASPADDAGGAQVQGNRSGHQNQERVRQRAAVLLEGQAASWAAGGGGGGVAGAAGPRVRRPTPAVDAARAALAAHTGPGIPPIIHQVYGLYDRAREDPAVHGRPQRSPEPSIQSFKRLNPNHTHILWGPDDVEALVDDMFPAFAPAYRSFSLPVLRADLARYLIVLAFGGVYSDTDTVCLKPVDSWADDQPPGAVRAIVGIEADAGAIPNWQRHWGRALQICQWTFAAEPAHPLLAHVVSRIAHLLETHPPGNVTSEDVIHVTGPSVMSDAAADYLRAQGHAISELAGLTSPRLCGDVLVLPITGFSPGVGHMGAGNVWDPQAKVQHGFAGSWRGQVRGGG